MAGKILIRGSIIRAAYGFVALLLPNLLAKAVGMDERDVDSDARYFNRLFGGRDLLVACGTVAAVKRGQEQNAATANIVCEFTDTISAVQELRSRGKIDRTLAIGFAFNVAGYLTWLRALLALGRD